MPVKVKMKVSGKTAALWGFAKRAAYGVMLCLFLGALPVQAVRPAVDCRKPFVFPDAAINIVILPYASSSEGLSPTARQLTLLMEMEMLFSILKYESVGVVRLVGPSGNPECGADAVLAKLTGQRSGAERTLKPGHGLILLWGRIYEEDDVIYIQNYMRFLRLGVAETLSVSILKRPFTSQFPARAVAFPPQQLTKQDVSRIAETFAKSAVLHSSPSEGAAKTPLPLDASFDRQYSYYVTRVQGDWMYLEAGGGGPDGWLKRQRDFDWVNVAKGGKLHLVEALAGYLRYRVGKDGAVRGAPRGTQEAAIEAAMRFEQTPAAAATPMALAIAKTVRAYFAGEGQGGASRAWELLREAAALVPFSADARNLELQARLGLAYQGAIPGVKASEVNADFLKAATLEPDNALVLANLEEFYQLSLSAQRLPGAESDKFYDRPELQQRLQAVHNVRAPQRFPEQPPGDRPPPSPQPPGTEYAGDVTMDVMVEDATGAVVPGVSITIKHRASGRSYSMQADVQGHAIIRNLPAGEYEVVASLSGFSAAKKVVTLLPNASQTVTIQFK